jgi:putative acetyltransferase
MPAPDEPRPLVRPETPADVPVVREVVAAAFGEEPVAELLDGLRASTAWRDLSFVAELAGEVVGHVSFTRGWLDAPARLVEVLVLSPLSVRPDLHARGIGTALVREALDALTGRPEPVTFLEGAPGYYPRFGFVPGETLGFTRPSVRIPPAAFMALPRPTYRPWMRGALVYPEVFWEHDCVGLRDSGDGPLAAT